MRERLGGPSVLTALTAPANAYAASTCPIPSPRRMNRQPSPLGSFAALATCALSSGSSGWRMRPPITRSASSMHASATLPPVSSRELRRWRSMDANAAAGPVGYQAIACGFIRSRMAARARSAGRLGVFPGAWAISPRIRPSSSIAATARVTCLPSGDTSMQAQTCLRCHVEASGCVGAGFPCAVVDGAVKVLDALAENFGAEDVRRVGGQRGLDRLGGYAAAEVRVGLADGVPVVEFAVVGRGPFEDAHRRVVSGAGDVEQLVEDDALVVARVAHGPDLAIVAGHGGLGERGPRFPVALFAQLVDVYLVVAAAAACFAVGGADLVPGSVGEPEVLVAGGEAHAAPFVLEVGVVVNGVLGHEPLFAGEGEFLCDAEDARSGPHVHAPGADAALEVAFPVLPGDDDEDDAEAVGAVGVELQGVLDGDFLPGKQRLPDEPGEVDEHS